MNSLVFNNFKLNYALGEYNLSADTYYIALMSPNLSAVQNLEDYNTWPQLSAYEVSGTEYNRNGQQLTGKTLVRNDSTNKIIWDASDVQWKNSTITAIGAIIYHSPTNLLVCYEDYGEVKTTQNGTFYHSFNSNGILNIN